MHHLVTKIFRRPKIGIFRFVGGFNLNTLKFQAFHNSKQYPCEKSSKFIWMFTIQPKNQYAHVLSLTKNTKTLHLEFIGLVSFMLFFEIIYCHREFAGVFFFQHQIWQAYPMILVYKSEKNIKEKDHQFQPNHFTQQISAIFQMEYSYLGEKKSAFMKNKMKLWVDAAWWSRKSHFLTSRMEQTKS